MPCNSDYGDNNIRYEERLHDGVNAARLCGILQVLKAHGLEQKVLDEVDWKEVGTTRHKFDRWWAHHQKADLARKEREARVKNEKKQARKLANKPWADLSKPERALVLKYGDA